MARSAAVVVAVIIVVAIVRTVIVRVVVTVISKTREQMTVVTLTLPGQLPPTLIKEPGNEEHTR